MRPGNSNCLNRGLLATCWQASRTLGDIIGEVELLGRGGGKTGFYRIATVTAVTSCDLAFIPYEQMCALLEEFPVLQQRLEAFSATTLKLVESSPRSPMAATRLAGVSPSSTAIGDGTPSPSHGGVRLSPLPSNAPDMVLGIAPTNRPSRQRKPTIPTAERASTVNRLDEFGLKLECRFDTQDRKLEELQQAISALSRQLDGMASSP